MIYYIIKVIISATLIVAISEISKKSSLIGGILASVPLVSVLGMVWLYIDTQNAEKVSQFSTSVFWLVIPSLSLFIALPILLKMKMNFYLALPISIVVMIVFYYLTIFILGKIGIKL
jgi:ABC-type xylose transport system permease subunit